MILTVILSMLLYDPIKLFVIDGVTNEDGTPITGRLMDIADIPSEPQSIFYHLKMVPGRMRLSVSKDGTVTIPEFACHSCGPKTCDDALWVVVKDSIDFLSGRPIRIRPALEKALEVCE